MLFKAQLYKYKIILSGSSLSGRLDSFTYFFIHDESPKSGIVPRLEERAVNKTDSNPQFHSKEKKRNKYNILHGDRCYREK